MIPQQSNLSAAIGGKWLGYVPAYLALLPLWFMGSILSSPLYAGWGILGPTIAINFLALGTCAGVFFLCRATLWRNRLTTGTSLWSVILGGLLLGVTKALATGLLTNVFLVDDNYNYLGRIISNSVLGIGVVVGVPLLFSQLELHRAVREQLIAQLVRQDLTYTPVPEASGNHVSNPSRRGKESQTLEDFVTRSRHRLNLARSKPSLLPLILDEIREKDARALSHKIWERESARIPDFTIPNLAAVSLSRLNFVILPVLIVYILVAGPIQLVSFGIASGLLALAIQCLLISGVLLAARNLPPAGIQRGVIVFLTAVTFCTLFIALVTPFITTALPPTQNLQNALSIFLLLACTIFATSIFNLARHTTKQVQDNITQLSPNLQDEAVNRFHSARLNLELAHLLHSHVQNVLSSRIVQLEADTSIEKASDREQNEIFLAAIEDLDTYLLGLLDTPTPSPAYALTLADIQQSWRGVVDISLHEQSPESSFTPEENALIASIVTEAVSNSVKHGLAKQIDLTVSLNVSAENSLVYLVVDDDGVGVRQGQPGLGTMFLNSTPHLTWELMPSNQLGGAMLKVEIEREP